ncbi:MAG TPA: pyridoxal-dependent decarboxylase, partial [Dongiaceae bacterium]|nr:pyridoxal-dependent decarboxylase [Dongiaceae bacterium]
AAHRDTFAVNPEYLAATPRGLAAAEWLYDYGLQTSRGFRALKVWMAIKEHGLEKFGRLIDQNIAQGQFLTRLVEAEPLLELRAPTSINIVCFRYRPPNDRGSLDEAALKALNIEIILRLQEEGTAVISDTMVHGRHCLRVAINNHRTRRSDLDLLVREVVRLGGEIAATL